MTKFTPRYSLGELQANHVSPESRYATSQPRALCHQPISSVHVPSHQTARTRLFPHLHVYSPHPHNANALHLLKFPCFSSRLSLSLHNHASQSCSCFLSPQPSRRQAEPLWVLCFGLCSGDFAGEERKWVRGLRSEEFEHEPSATNRRRFRALRRSEEGAHARSYRPSGLYCSPEVFP